MAERMKIALPKIINYDQTGFLKGRYIGQNITTIMDTIYFTQDKKYTSACDVSWFWKSIRYFRMAIYVSVSRKIQLPTSYETMGPNTLHWHQKLCN